MNTIVATELACKEVAPQSAMQVNEDGQLALHLFCQDESTATTEECEKLLRANPSAVSKRDVYGRTPLFYALKRDCSEEVIRLIFEAYPEAVMERDFCGMTPMYLVYHGSKHPSILKAILQHRPSLALKRICSFSGPDLVRLVCSPWENMLKGTNAEDVRHNVDLSKQWEKVVLTVRAAHKCRHKESDRTHELHLALELPCSPKILKWFLRMYPEQLRVPMADGKLPLHHLVNSPAFITHKDADTILEQFLVLYPEAAKIRCNGKLPLHLAIESGCLWTNGLKRLLYSYPDARQMPADKSNMLPFMMMATCETSDFSTMFSLLREGPELVL